MEMLCLLDAVHGWWSGGKKGSTDRLGTTNLVKRCWACHQHPRAVLPLIWLLNRFATPYLAPMSSRFATPHAAPISTRFATPHYLVPISTRVSTLLPPLSLDQHASRLSRQPCAHTCIHTQYPPPATHPGPLLPCRAPALTSCWLPTHASSPGWPGCLMHAPHTTRRRTLCCARCAPACWRPRRRRSVAAAAAGCEAQPAGHSAAPAGCEVQRARRGVAAGYEAQRARRGAAAGCEVQHAWRGAAAGCEAQRCMMPGVCTAGVQERAVGARGEEHGLGGALKAQVCAGLSRRAGRNEGRGALGVYRNSCGWPARAGQVGCPPAARQYMNSTNGRGEGALLHLLHHHPCSLLVFLVLLLPLVSCRLHR